MEFRCPNCLSLIYSRKAKVCGNCGRPLPDEIRLSEKQVAFLNKQEKDLEQHAKEYRLPTLAGEIDSGTYMLP